MVVFVVVVLVEVIVLIVISTAAFTSSSSSCTSSSSIGSVMGVGLEIPCSDSVISCSSGSRSDKPVVVTSVGMFQVLTGVPVFLDWKENVDWTVILVVPAFLDLQVSWPMDFPVDPELLAPRDWADHQVREKIQQPCLCFNMWLTGLLFDFIRNFDLK